MKTELTLQEKLRDLRDEKKMTLSDLSGATGIPLSTLQRMEGRDDVRIGYQDVAELARFYNVSTDYLFGLTDNRQHRHIEIDALHLSDPAIEVLRDGNFNKRLVSEIISHPDFARLIQALEVYIDRKVAPQMNAVNSMYKFMENTLKENFEISDNDEVITLLQEAVVDEDEYLRYRISERFNILVRSLFVEHKMDTLEDEQANILQEMKDGLENYMQAKDKGRAKLTLLARQIGLNINDLTDDEKLVLVKAVEKSKRFKQAKKRR